jgi:tetratricopeptide (TPR) repeat protein
VGRFSGILGLLVAATGCASAPFRGPEAGGDRWLEATSPHFRMASSQSEGSVRETLEELEVSYAALEQVAFPSSDNPSGMTRVVVLPQADFELLVASMPIGKNVAGFFSRGGPLSQRAPLLVIKGGAGSQALPTLQHELTHRFVAFHFPSAPVWLNEGLAMFWQSMEVDHGRLTFGGTVRTLVRPTRYPELLALRASQFFQGDEFDVQANYVGAQALTYVLYFQHRDALNAYLNGLKSGSEAGTAWASALDSVSVTSKTLEEEYYRFFEERGTLATLPAPAPSVEVEVNEMSPSTVHVLWAELLQQQQSLDAALRHANWAVDLDPQSPDALLVRADVLLSSKRPDDAQADLERAIVLEPPSSLALAEALRFSLRARRSLTVSKKELARRLLKFKLASSQQAIVAEYLRTEGDFTRGLRFVSDAIRADSSCVDCYFVGAQLLADNGDLSQAAGALRIALSLSGERASKEQWRMLRELEAAAARRSPGEK